MPRVSSLDRWMKKSREAQGERMSNVTVKEHRLLLRIYHEAYRCQDKKFSRDLEKAISWANSYFDGN